MPKDLASCLDCDKCSINDSSYNNDNDSSCNHSRYYYIFSHEWDWEGFFAALSMVQILYLTEHDV